MVLTTSCLKTHKNNNEHNLKEYHLIHFNVYNIAIEFESQTNPSMSLVSILLSQ